MSLNAEPHPTPRRLPSTIGGACYLVLLAATIAAIVLTMVTDDWRLGVRVIAGCLIALAGLRLVLPERDAGMLAVRRRPIDVAIVTSTGVALFVLAASIPDQPTL